MKKATLNAIYETLKTMDYDPEILSEIETELNKSEARKQANAEVYEQIKPIVFKALSIAVAPVTVGELFDSIESELPDGVTKGKVQYAMTRLWIDELVKTEGKPNTYSLR